MSGKKGDKRGRVPGAGQRGRGRGAEAKARRAHLVDDELDLVHHLNSSRRPRGAPVLKTARGADVPVIYRDLNISFQRNIGK